MQKRIVTSGQNEMILLYFTKKGNGITHFLLKKGEKGENERKNNDKRKRKMKKSYSPYL